MMESSPLIPELVQARANLRAALSQKPDLIEIRRVGFDQFIDLAIGTDTEIGKLINSVLTNNITGEETEIGPSDLLTRMLRYMTYALLQAKYPGFPEDVITLDDWWRAHDFIYNDYDRSGPFEEFVKHRNLPSNVPDRYKALKLALQLGRFAGRLDLITGNCTRADIGCSGQLGDKMLQGIPDKYLFGHPGYVSNGSADNSQPYMKAVAMLLDEQINLGPAVGIDIFTPEDNKGLLRACSLSPDELADPSHPRVRLFDKLDKDKPGNLGFVRGDFTTEFERIRGKIESQFPGFRPQLVHISMALYEDVPKNQYAILDRAKAWATDFVVVTDNLYVIDGKIYIRKNWQDDEFPCRTAMIDVRYGGGAQEIAIWNNSRLTRLAPGLGEIATKGGRHHVSLESMLNSKVSEPGFAAAPPIDVRPTLPHSVTFG